MKDCSTEVRQWVIVYSCAAIHISGIHEYGRALQTGMLGTYRVGALSVAGRYWRFAAMADEWPLATLVSVANQN
jgi:hypothetical protein